MSIENVPNVNSEEFEKILEEHGWIKKEVETEDKCCCDGNCSCNNSEEKTSQNDKFELKDAISEWSMKHPSLSFAIFLGGASLIAYKISQSFIAGAIHKGNLKTIRYLDRIGR